jgi:hypothetical protein
MSPPARRHPLLLGLALVTIIVTITACAGSSTSSTASAAQPAAPLPRDAALITVQTTAGTRIAPGFLGLSLENDAVLPYAGTDPHAINRVLVQLIRNLTPGQTPDLRIGGDSTDWAWWPVAGMPKPPGVRITLTTQWLAVTRAVTRALHARLTLGIDLEAGSRGLAAAEANAFERGIGSASIEGLEIGNEPELYPIFGWYQSHGHPVPGRPPSYDFRAFVRDFSSFSHALPGPLAGPATGAPKWMAGLRPFLAAEPRVKVATLHRYPVQQCFVRKSSPQYPTIAHLLAPYASRDLANSVASYVGIAHAHHIPLRIDEMNTVSCGGAPGVSNAFVSALWALDALFQMARVGVDGVNIHTYPRAPYELFTFAQTHGTWQATVAPEYYGLLMFAQAAPPGSRLLATSAQNATGIQTWATRGTDGHTRVVLINESHNLRTIGLTAPGGASPASATLERLSAPRLTSTGGVTLGGQSFGAATTTGTLAGRPSLTHLTKRGGRYAFGLPAGSAALITL